MNGGTFNITRNIWDHDAFRNEPFTQREAWMWLISEAEWRPRERRIGRRAVSLERGQLAHSVRFMAERWKWSKSRVERVLNMLENRDMLRRETGTLGQVITICNYDEYQFPVKDSGTVAGQSPGRQRDSSGTNHKKINKINKEETIVSSVRNAPERFDEFWDAYPHRGGSKKGRKPSLAKYTAAVKRGVSEQDIIDGAMRYGHDRGVLDGYAKNPETWLNQEGWADEIEPRFAAISGGQHGQRNSKGSRKLDAALAAVERHARS